MMDQCKCCGTWDASSYIVVAIGDNDHEELWCAECNAVKLEAESTGEWEVDDA